MAQQTKYPDTSRPSITPKALDLAAWVFPFLGAILVLRGGHVILIVIGCVAGLIFRRVVGYLRMLDQRRKIRDIDHQLVARMRTPGGVDEF